MNFIGLEQFEKNLLINKKYRAFKSHYYLAHEVSKMIMKARIAKGVSQAKLAKLIHTQQANIARIENGKSLPSLRTLEKIAKAFGSHLIAPRFAFLEEARGALTTVQSADFRNDHASNIQPRNTFWYSDKLFVVNTPHQVAESVNQFKLA